MADKQLFYLHTATEGTRWDTLAWTYYRDPYNYPPIIRANPAYQGFWLLPAGAQIRVPVLEQAAAQPTENLPPWRR